MSVKIADIHVNVADVSWLADRLGRGRLSDAIDQELAVVRYVLASPLEGGLVDSDVIHDPEDNSRLFDATAPAEDHRYSAPRLLGSLLLRGWDPKEVPDFPGFYTGFEIRVLEIDRQKEDPDPNAELWHVGSDADLNGILEEMAEIHEYDRTHADAN